MRPPQRTGYMVPAGAVTPQMIVAACRACAYARDAHLAVPTHRDQAPETDESWVDDNGWVHDHLVTPETEQAADRLYTKDAQ